ncbi:MAG: hypothetical protein LBV79_03510 [Candidatus Adiutrix sp.]|jgi:hypothetical protein|nr:hypothetical protein [Candidatus Adiutrix sp.]
MMTSQAFQKHGEPAFALRGRLRLVVLCLFLWAFVVVCPALARAAGEEAASAAQTAPCKGLKPYNNIDELLYQFYINLDSECIFEMPLEELEKIWGVKILDSERAKPHNYYPLSETDFGNKPYRSEKDAFYIELIKTYPMNYHAGRNDINLGTSGGYVAFNGDIVEFEGTVTTTFLIRTTKGYYEKYGEVLPSEKLRELFHHDRDDQRGHPCELPRAEGEITPSFFYDIDGQTNATYHGRSMRFAPGGCRYYYYRGQRASNKLYSSDIFVYPDKIRIDRKQTPKEFAAQEALKPEKKSMKKAGEWKDAPCRGLKPVRGLEDILYQFYINMDSNCISKMPLEELEKVWGTRISSKQHGVAADVANRPYESEKYGFYITHEKNGDAVSAFFTIWITDEYKEKYGTLVPDGRFPRLLPHPLIYSDSFYSSSPMPTLNIALPRFSEKRPGNIGPFPFYLYKWYNTDRSQKIQMYTHERSVLIFSLGSTQVEPSFINKNR